MNQINVIHPYLYQGQWVFDDESKKLDKEPFVSGTDVIMTELSANVIKDGKFTLRFSEHPFPGHEHSFIRLYEEYDGWWFEQKTSPTLVGWLCPAMFCYFDNPPEFIYVQALPF